MKTIERQIIETYEALDMISLAQKRIGKPKNKEQDEKLGELINQELILRTELSALKSQLKDEEQPITDRLKAQKAQPGDEPDISKYPKQFQEWVYNNIKDDYKNDYLAFLFSMYDPDYDNLKTG